MQWMMLQQDQPEDFVIATGKQYSVREFITWSAAELGLTLEFTGEGVDEIATVAAITGDMAPALNVGRCRHAHRPALFPPGRGGDAAGRPVQGQADNWAGSRRSPPKRCAPKWLPKT